MPYLYCMATATTTREIEMTTTDTNISNADFGRALELLMNEWDRCIAIYTEKGMTKKEAAAIVAPQMTEWMNENEARYQKKVAA